MQRLKKILGYRRPHESIGESKFVTDILGPYAMTPYLDEAEEVLAYVLDVADDASIVPPVLWCCHIDTVHDVKNVQPYQKVLYDKDIGMMYRPKDAKDCLGADDGAGVWMLLEMIDAGVPGTYIFHRGEEVGGTGSSGMADYHTEWLKRFKWAIAFDRRDADCVITEQFRGRCCSEEFALAFAHEINGRTTCELKPDPTGTFTDTANYTHLIPECTNISVGYTQQHTPKEDLDCEYLALLRDTVIEAFSKGVNLPVVREAKEESKYDIDFMYENAYSGYNRKYSTTNTFRDSDTGKRLSCFNLEAEDVIALKWSDLCNVVSDASTGELADLVLRLAENVIMLRELFAGSRERVDDPTQDDYEASDEKLDAALKEDIDEDAKERERYESQAANEGLGQFHPSHG